MATELTEGEVRLRLMRAIQDLMAPRAPRRKALWAAFADSHGEKVLPTLLCAGLHMVGVRKRGDRYEEYTDEVWGDGKEEG